MQEALCWDEESIVFTRLKCKDPLADRTGVQAIFASQPIQKLEVGEVQGKVRSRIGCRGSTLRRESRDEDWIEAQQSGGPMLVFDKI